MKFKVEICKINPMNKIFLSILLLSILSCGEPVDNDTENSSSFSNTTSAEQSLEQLASGEITLSSVEEKAFWEFIALQGEWNYYAEIFIEAYLDDSVGIDEFLEIGIFSYNELAEIYNQMSTSYDALKTQLLIDMFKPALDNYFKKINALYTILEGVDMLDVELEERGLMLLSEAAEEGKQVACDFRENLNSESIRSILQDSDLEKLNDLSDLCRL
tara:strand:+ start:1825 stop:2472 length:648 start_codon:yes stop_codon:yes gene_type:complete